MSKLTIRLKESRPMMLNLQILLSKQKQQFEPKSKPLSFSGLAKPDYPPPPQFLVLICDKGPHDPNNH